MLNLEHEYICPYCANKATMRNFLLFKADGTYNKKHTKCPLCNKRMRIATLKAEMTPFEWGLWIYLNIRIYNSPYYKFYDDWQHEIFFLNLDLLPRNMKNDWWKGFKKYKGTSDKEAMKRRLEELNVKFGIRPNKKITLGDFMTR